MALLESVGSEKEMVVGEKEGSDTIRMQRQTLIARCPRGVINSCRLHYWVLIPLLFFNPTNGKPIPLSEMYLYYPTTTILVYIHIKSGRTQLKG